MTELQVRSTGKNISKIDTGEVETCLEFCNPMHGVNQFIIAMSSLSGTPCGLKAMRQQRNETVFFLFDGRRHQNSNCKPSEIVTDFQKYSKL